MSIFYKTMEREINEIQGRPRLLLHSCCGPCSSSVLDFLKKHFEITVFYSNSNIYPEEEYKKRLENQRKLVKSMFPEGNVGLLESRYDHNSFLEAAKGTEAEREGGLRCEKCFALRLEDTARAAMENGFEYFTTTLSVSPHKNAEKINAIGMKLTEKYTGIKYLMSDFKKKDGYRRSIELSKKYGLYRQNYCGCEFSKGHS